MAGSSVLPPRSVRPGRARMWQVAGACVLSSPIRVLQSGSRAVDDTHLLDQDQGLLIIAVRPDDKQNRSTLLPVTHLERSSPAARILRSYAALLALEGWDVSPHLPSRARSGGKSKGNKSRPLSLAERRRRARTPQALAGALLRVRSLSVPPRQPAYLPPPPPQSRMPHRPPCRALVWRVRIRRSDVGDMVRTRPAASELIDHEKRLCRRVYPPTGQEGLPMALRPGRIPSSSPPCNSCRNVAVWRRPGKLGGG